MSRLKLFALDIETASQGKRANDYVNKTQKFKAPANIKDPDKIKANLDGQKEKANSKHALSWVTGKIVSCAVSQCFGTETLVSYGHNEASILTEIAKVISCHKLIGKSSQTFDFPFLVGRYMANKIPVPAALKSRYGCMDIDTFFGFSSQSGQRGSLASYSHGIGLDGKLMDGAMVPQMYKQILALDMEGRVDEANKLWKEIADYNFDDTEKVRHMAELYYQEGELDI